MSLKRVKKPMKLKKPNSIFDSLFNFKVTKKPNVLIKYFLHDHNYAINEHLTKNDIELYCKENIECNDPPTKYEKSEKPFNSIDIRNVNSLKDKCCINVDLAASNDEMHEMMGKDNAEFNNLRTKCEKSENPFNSIEIINVKSFEDEFINKNQEDCNDNKRHVISNLTVKLEEDENINQNENSSMLEYENRDELLAHIQIEHLDIKPEVFQCNKCSFSFLNDGEMIAHLKDNHSSSESFIKPLDSNSSNYDNIYEINITQPALLSEIISANNLVTLGSKKVDNDLSEENDWCIVDKDNTNHDITTEPYQPKINEYKCHEEEEKHTTMYNFLIKEQFGISKITQCKESFQFETEQNIESKKENNVKCQQSVHSRDFYVGSKDRQLKMETSTGIKYELINGETNDSNNVISNDIYTDPYNMINNNDGIRCDIEKHEYANIKSIKTSKVQHTIPKYLYLDWTKQLITCTICDKELSYKSWRAHMKEVHSEDKVICKICNAEFKCKRYLRRHIRVQHERRKPTNGEQNKTGGPETSCHTKISCKLCHSTFMSRIHLDTHMGTFHFNDEMKFSCKMCSKKLKSPRLMKIHVRRSHPETLQWCPYCQKLFYKIGHLKAHLKLSINCKKTAEKNKICENTEIIVE